MKIDNEKNKKIIFISGGVRSGKSTFAEKIAIRYAKKHKHQLSYIATSKVEDEEMENRIIRHRQQRLKSEIQWRTFEISNYFPENIRKIKLDGVVLLDCLTVLLANELFSTIVQENKLNKHSERVAQRIIDGLMVLTKKVQTLIIVSNEIQHEFIDDVYVKAYQRTLGQLHQKIVKKSDVAYLVEATIPQLMKGDYS